MLLDCGMLWYRTWRGATEPWNCRRSIPSECSPKPTCRKHCSI